jgi:low temperature requirement protein LtrA
MADRVTKHFRIARVGDQRVTPIELILDVVFVLGFSQCTDYMITQGGWQGMGDALITLALFWRGWVEFSWFASDFDPNSVVVRLAIFTAMGGFLMMAVTIPRAFDDFAPSFVAAYAVIRLVQMGLGLLASRQDAQFRRAVIQTAISGLVALTLLFVGSFIDGFWGYVCWVVAIVADYVMAVFSQFGWKLAAGHFAERYSLIVIIAMGESILSIGLGADVAHANARTLLVAMTGVAFVACLWATYFDGTDTAAEHALVNTPAGVRQNELARRAYSLLHFPLVVGVIILALGLESAVAHPAHRFDQHIAAAFFGGIALYLLASVAFGYVTTKVLNRPRLAVGFLVSAMIPLGATIPAWASVALVTAILAVLVVAQRLTRGGTTIHR